MHACRRTHTRRLTWKKVKILEGIQYAKMATGKLAVKGTIRAARPRITFFIVFCFACVSWSIGTSLPRSTLAKKVAPVMSGRTYHPEGSEELQRML